MRRTLNASRPTRLATTAAILLLSVAAATFLFGELEASPGPEPTNPPSHPCAGMPSIITMITADELAAGNDIVSRANAPSGNCSLTTTIYVSEASLPDPPSTSATTCTIQVRTTTGTEGTVVKTARSGVCSDLRVSARIELSAAGAQAAQALLGSGAANSGKSIARARVLVYGFLLGGRIESDVRGTWNHTANSVNLISLTYPRRNTVAWLTGGPDAPSTQYGISPPSIAATNTVRWYDDDSDGDLRLKTNATLTMLAGGGYHCSYWGIGYPSLESLGDTDVDGECFP